jgi:L-asparaginase / beta-aspartyl-peptidase
VRALSSFTGYNVSKKQSVSSPHWQNELEASLALSRPPASHPDIPPSRRALSLTLLTRTRNPSQLARELYLSPASTRHAFLSGTPAEGLGLPEDEVPGEGEDGCEDGDESETTLDMMPMGTVGAVALDMRGCIAACTSTGGRTNKLPGRVGDTPHLGAGFWAEEWQAPRLRWRRWGRWLPRPWRRKAHAVGVSGTGDGDVCPFPCG